MSTSISKKIACAVCQRATIVPLAIPPDNSGSVDLDLRPASSYRNTMHLWLQECPVCRYVHSSLDVLLAGAADIVYTAEYRLMTARETQLGLAGRFMRHAYLLRDQPFEAGWAMLRAAWVGDDLGRDDLARYCRRVCDNHWVGLPYGDDEQSMLLRAVSVDVLRRARCFFEAGRLAEELLAMQTVTPVLQRILNFQRQLISDFNFAAFTWDAALAAFPGYTEVHAPQKKQA